MCEVYLIFATDWKDCCDFSEEMMLELFYTESYGEIVSPNNGYYIGKRYLNLTLAMWKEDLKKGLLFEYELYNDIFPHWWLDKVLKK